MLFSSINHRKTTNSKKKNKEKQKIVRKEKEKTKNIWSIPLYLLLLHVI